MEFTKAIVGGKLCTKQSLMYSNKEIIEKFKRAIDI